MSRKRVVRLGFHLAGLRFLNAAEIDLHLRGGFDDLVQQVADHLVTVGRDPDLLPTLDEFTDHVGARVRLSRSRRALDREDAFTKLASDAKRSLQGRFALLPDRSIAKLRSEKQQECPGALIGPVPFAAMVGDVLLYAWRVTRPVRRLRTRSRIFVVKSAILRKLLPSKPSNFACSKKACSGTQLLPGPRG